jgi:imidazolonepropionase-like amidohydrolase
MTATLLTNVSIFDGSGAPSFPGEVFVEGDRIKAVAQGAEHIDAPGADIVDGAGGTFMPGLIEPHAHLTFTSAVDRIVRSFMPSVEEHAFITLHNAMTIFDHGYTSAFSGGATRPRIEVQLRDEIAAGYLPGPRIKAASFERSVQGNAGAESNAKGPGLEQLDKFCREMIELGVDSFKLIVSGAGSIFPDKFDILCYSPEKLELVSRMAKENGKKLLGHCYNSESIRLAVQYGFDAIYHCNFADEPTLDLMEQHKDKFVVVPANGIVESSMTRLDLIPEMRKRGIRVLPAATTGSSRTRTAARRGSSSCSRRSSGTSRPRSCPRRRRAARGSWTWPTNWARSGLASSRTSCSSTAIRCRTSPSSRTRTSWR